MPLDPNAIADALELDLNVGGNLATVMAVTAHLDFQIAQMNLIPYARMRAESLVTAELGDWRFNSTAGGPPMPANIPGWLNGADQCLVNATVRLQGELQFSAQSVASNEQAYQDRKLQHQAEAERMDEEAPGLGLPTVQEIDSDNEPVKLGMARMDEVVAAQLDEHEAIGTIALSSCTGVTLFDPETNVGAVMHVYEGNVTIDDAVEIMQEIDPDVDPARLQVILMPGVSEGVNMSHLASLHSQLAGAGITQVRDLSREGRTAGELWLKGDGTVLGDMNPMSMALQNEAPQVAKRERSASVGEVLGMGKHAPKKTEGVGEEVSGPETRLKRSNSEPNLKGGRKL
jgi:hypothetical protein